MSAEICRGGGSSSCFRKKILLERIHLRPRFHYEAGQQGRFQGTWCSQQWEGQGKPACSLLSTRQLQPVGPRPRLQTQLNAVLITVFLLCFFDFFKKFFK
jgi:hypothetical protein